MKKVIFMLAMSTAILCACSNDDKDKPELNETSITLNAEEKFTLEISPKQGSVSWSSDNEYVCTVSSSGVVTAKHVGEATITANGLTCKVTVKPLHTMYEEPYTQWGASKLRVKQYVGTNPESESNSILIYRTTNRKAPKMQYWFDDNELWSSLVNVDTDYTSEMLEFLSERYLPVVISVEDLEGAFINALKWEDATTVILFQLENIYYWRVIYVDPDITAEAVRTAGTQEEFVEKIWNKFKQNNKEETNSVE